MGKVWRKGSADSSRSKSIASVFSSHSRQSRSCVMSKYILNYFPVTGRAEPSRLMFHFTAVPFTDNQIPHSEWSNVKTDVKRFPLSQLPTLEVDDVVICQSGAINRYVARQLGCYGSNELERALIDQIVETLDELKEGYAKIKFNPALEETAKAEELKDFFNKDRTKLLLGFIEGKLSESAGEFFLGDKPSFADLVYFTSHEYLVHVKDDFEDEHPELKMLHRSVAGVETIKKYLEQRDAKLFS